MSNKSPSVQRILDVPTEQLSASLAETQSWLRVAETNYDTFQNGGWKLIGLMNQSGDPSDTTVREGTDTIGTSALEDMPTLQSLLTHCLGNSAVKLARLARFQPGGRLWEHVDYTELAPDDGTRRYHLPLKTEKDAILIADNNRTHLSAGSLWRIDPRGPHGIAHRGNQDRIHVIVDAIPGPELTTTTLPIKSADQAALPELDSRNVEKLIDEHAKTLAADPTQEDNVISAILELFYDYNLPQTTHSMIVAVAEKANNTELRDLWTARSRDYMGT